MAPLIIGTDDPDRQSLYQNQQSLTRIGLATQVRNDGPVTITLIPVIQSGPGIQPPLVADSEPTDTYQFAIGLPDQTATGGTFDLTVAGSTTNLLALAYNISAASLQTPFNVAMVAAGKSAATITEIDTGVYRVVANANGAVLTGIVTADPDALIPTCDIEISEVSLGSVSSPYRLLIQIRQAPVAYCEPATPLPSTGVTRTNTQALSATTNAVDTITFNNVDPVSGTFICAATAFGVTKSFVVPWNASAADMLAILEQHTILAGNINVKKSGSAFIVEFINALGPQRILSSTLANPTVITTEGNHGFSNGFAVTHSGTNSTPNTDGAQTVSGATDDTYTVAVNVSAAGTTGVVRPTTAPSLAVTDNDLVAPQGVSGLLYLNNENLYEYSLSQEDSFFMSASVTRTRASGVRETILGPMPIQLFKDLVSRSTLVPLPLPSYYTSVQSDARYGRLDFSNAWTKGNTFTTVVTTDPFTINGNGDVSINNTGTMTINGPSVLSVFCETSFVATATLFGGIGFSITSTAISYTVLVTDSFIGVTSTAAPRVITLPNAALTNGRIFIVKDQSGGAATNNITVKSAGGSIDGVAAATGVVISSNYGSLSFYSNGVNYFIF